MSDAIDLKVPAEGLDREGWNAELRAMGAEHGFFEELGADHTVRARQSPAMGLRFCAKAGVVDPWADGA